MTMPNSGIVSMASMMFCCRFCKSYHDHDPISADVNGGIRISSSTSDILLHIPSVLFVYLSLSGIVLC